MKRRPNQMASTVARLVAQECRRALDAAAERLLDAKGHDLERAVAGAVVHVADLAGGADAPQIVVASRQVEEQVADRAHARAANRLVAGPSRRGCGSGRPGCPGRSASLGGDQIAVMGLPAFDDLDLDAGPVVAQALREVLGL